MKMIKGSICKNTRTLTYQCSPGVAWTVEMDGIFLLNRSTGAVCQLDYPRAAIWDLVSRGYRTSRLIPVISAIASLGWEETDRLVMESLEDWTKAGFLKKA
jgi:hypothetical protein